MEEIVRLPFGVGKRVDKTEKNPFGWEELNTAHIDILSSQKPVVLCFGGNGVISPRQANYNSKLIEGFIGKESCNIYSFYYGNFNNNKGDLLPEEIDQIYNDIFSPLIYDKNGNIYSQQKIENNFNKVVFVTHCMGDFYVNVLGAKIHEELVKSGYQPDSANHIMQKLINISYAPFNLNTKNSIPKMQFITLRDQILDNQSIEFEDENEKVEYMGAGKLIKENNKLTLVANSFANLDEMLNEHAIKLIELGNGVSRYSKNDQRILTIANCFSLALSYAILNKRDLNELQTILQNELDKQQNTEFEKHQKQLYEWDINGGKPIDVFMKEKGITESQIINGEVKILDKLPYLLDKTGFKNYKKINYDNSSYDKFYNTPTLKRNEESQKIKKHALNSLFLEKNEINRQYLITKDGFETVLPSDNKQQIKYYTNAQIYKFDLNNCINVVIKAKSATDAQQNEIVVSAGKKFEDKKYNTFKELYQSIIPSIKKDEKIELTPEQTRLILSSAIEYNVPINNIILDKNLSLNSEVIHNEVDIKDDKTIKVVSQEAQIQK